MKPDENTTGVSKKLAIATTAISAVVASDNWIAQAFVAAIACFAITAQFIIDWKKNVSDTKDVTPALEDPSVPHEGDEPGPNS